MLVTFQRVGGSSVRIDAARDELLAVAGALEARGRPQLAERLLAATKNRPGTTVVVGDYDMPMLVAAVAATRKSAGLGTDWARLRDL